MADKLRVRIFSLISGTFKSIGTSGTAGMVPRLRCQFLGRISQQFWSRRLRKASPQSLPEFTSTASVNSNSEKDRKLSGWLHHSMAGLTGYIVDVRERKPRKTVKCQEENCRTPITSCPVCKKPLKGTVEKGIDAAVITDLITLAFDDNYDLAVLICGDADYAPAVRYIQRKTDKQVVQAFFKAHGDELRNACWDHAFFDDLMAKLLPTSTSKSNATT
jgi:uncharacterized LabA/DUF88 family protein